MKEQLRYEILDEIKRVVNNDKLQFESYMEELNWDSFLIVQLFVDLEEKYKFEFSLDDMILLKYINLSDLIDKVMEYIKSQKP